MADVEKLESRAVSSMGSLNEFAAIEGLDAGSREALAAYTVELQHHRARLASALGVTAEGLHAMCPVQTALPEVAIQTEAA